MNKGSSIPIEFPKIKHACRCCDGTGREDVSYHGSPLYVDCTYCKGLKDVDYFREMSVDEKLDFLLKKIGGA